MWAARRVLTPLIGGASACALMTMVSQPITAHAATSSTQMEATTAEWRQRPRDVLWPKISSILGKVIWPKEPEIPEWEQTLQKTHGLQRRDEMSRMAKSSSDGCLMVNPPRIYVHETPAPDEARKVLSASETEAASANTNATYAVWHFGKDAVGHPGLVHGGAISMALDESCGVAFFALDRGLGFTAYLHVNYRLPLPAGTPILITVRPKKIDGRKVTLEAVATDGGSTVFADGEALFVQPRASGANAASKLTGSTVSKL